MLLYKWMPPKAARLWNLLSFVGQLYSCDLIGFRCFADCRAGVRKRLLALTGDCAEAMAAATEIATSTGLASVLLSVACANV